MIVLIAIFSAFIALLAWQPYHNANLQALLPSPARCAVPCWAGIRPGVTSLSSAITLLQQHEWVAELEFTATSAPDSGELVWHWATPANHIFDTTRQGAAGIHRGIVTWLQLPTTLALGDMWLAKGEPTKAITRSSHASFDRVRHFVTYDEQSVQWRSAIACPWHVQDFWLARLDLWLGMTSFVEMPAYSRPTRTACRNG